MGILKLGLVTFGLLVVIVGFFFVAFALSGKKNTDGEECSTNGNTSSFGCGCGSGACGMPVNRHEG